MKIIKEPKVEDWNYSFTCEKCAAELEASGEDVFAHHSPGEGCYPPSTSYSVNCPVCGSSHFIPLDKVSAIVRVKADARRMRVSPMMGDH